MPRSPACRTCAQKKVACRLSSSTTACERCIEQHLRCEWPKARIVDQTARRKSCVQCREKHAKCEMHRFDLKACYTCLVKGFACSYDVEPATLESEKSEDASCSTSGSEHTSSASPRPTTVRTRTYWETVLPLNASPA
ncbi:hypothetical protein GY45DRAFT_596240 [Cubamyces sp. BRFM 1775]|nr:hypothetical protein GY45DRAFT_596240 [Cubamyces sp. BRFM 1775]